MIIMIIINPNNTCHLFGVMYVPKMCWDSFSHSFIVDKSLCRSIISHGAGGVNTYY